MGCGPARAALVQRFLTPTCRHECPWLLTCLYVSSAALSRNVASTVCGIPSAWRRGCAGEEGDLRARYAPAAAMGFQTVRRVSPGTCWKGFRGVGMWSRLGGKDDSAGDGLARRTDREDRRYRSVWALCGSTVRTVSCSRRSPIGTVTPCGSSTTGTHHGCGPGCCAVVGNESVVEEVVQDVFVAVWTKPGSWHGSGAVAAWIWGIGIRRLMSALRPRRPLPLRLLLPPAAPSAEEEVLLGIEHGPLAAAIDDLSPELRDVVRAIALDGLSSREAGRLLGVPAGTVRTRMARARTQLQEALT